MSEAQMFCFQCEQTAKGKHCTTFGVCGQNAVAILLTLLYLGIKNIRLGPSLPAFITPNVLFILVKNFNITPITTPEKDLKAILG